MWRYLVGAQEEEGGSIPSARTTTNPGAIVWRRGFFLCETE